MSVPVLLKISHLIIVNLKTPFLQGYYKDIVEFYFEERNQCKNFWKKCVEHHGFFRSNIVHIVHTGLHFLSQYHFHFVNTNSLDFHQIRKIPILFRAAKYVPLSTIFVQFRNQTRNCQKRKLLAGCFGIFPRRLRNFCFVENLNTSPMKISDLDKSEKL